MRESSELCGVITMRVDLIDSLGGDKAVVNAARVSFDKFVESIDSKDTKLINYLAKHNHWSPFAHAQVTVRVHMPIFVARQWMKSTVGIATNEVSRRYVDDTPQFYLPPSWRLRPDGSIKQGSAGDVDIETNYFLDTMVQDTFEECLLTYNKLLEMDIAPEQARIVLPQSTYTTVIQTFSIMAAARIYKQRIDPHAQVEIQSLAKLFGEAVAQTAPVSWSALIGE